jgi:itaconate CoA-transferase
VSKVRENNKGKPVGPLEGITVLALEQAVAAPFCTRQLADLGARVIKIERPETGDFARHYDERVHQLSSHFVWCNRSKESITLDVKHPDSKGILFRLLQKADIFVQNLAPGSAGRLGLSYTDLEQLYPRLIVCDISGYGSTGPYRDRKAYDLLIQAESGFLAVTGTPEESVKAGCAIADISAGMYAYSNILAALISRGKTGRGCRIDISIFESMVEWMSHPLYYGFNGADAPSRTGASHSVIYPYGPFVCGDGGMLLLAVQNEQEWKAFCRHVLDDPDLACDPRFSSVSRRSIARLELKEMIDRVFGAFTTEQIKEKLDAAAIANGRLNGIAEVWAHPQLKARNRWVEVETSRGSIPALVPSGLPSECAPRMDAVPALGEHTASILSELGFGQADISRFHSQHVV